LTRNWGMSGVMVAGFQRLTQAVRIPKAVSTGENRTEHKPTHGGGKTNKQTKKPEG
jgi:hypothetical protein